MYESTRRCISEDRNGIGFWLYLYHATSKPYVCTLTQTFGRIKVMGTRWSTNHHGESPCENIPSICSLARCLKFVWNIIKALENKILTTEMQQVCCVIDSLEELAAPVFRFGGSRVRKCLGYWQLVPQTRRGAVHWMAEKGFEPWNG